MEQPNLRTAIDFSIADKDEADAGLELVGRPWFLWVCLFLAEGRHWLDRALASTDGYSVNRLRALATAAYVASLQGDREAAEDLLAQGARGQELNPDAQTAAYLAHTRGLYSLFFDAAHCEQALTAALASTSASRSPRISARSRASNSACRGSSPARSRRPPSCSRSAGNAASRPARTGCCPTPSTAWAWRAFAESDLAAAADFVHQSLRIKRAFGDSLGLRWRWT